MNIANFPKLGSFDATSLKSAILLFLFSLTSVGFALDQEPNLKQSRLAFAQQKTALETDFTSSRLSLGILSRMELLDEKAKIYKLTLSIQPPAGFHLYSHHTSKDSGLVGVSILWQSVRPLGPLVESTPDLIWDKFKSALVSAHKNPFHLSTNLNISPEFFLDSPGKKKLIGWINYQVCNNLICSQVLKQEIYWEF